MQSTEKEFQALKLAVTHASSASALDRVLEEAQPRGRFGLADVLCALFSPEEAPSGPRQGVGRVLGARFPPDDVDLWCMELQTDATFVAGTSAGLFSEGFTCALIPFGLRRGAEAVHYASPDATGFELSDDFEGHVTRVVDDAALHLRSDLVCRWHPEVLLRTVPAAIARGTLEAAPPAWWRAVFSSSLLHSKAEHSVSTALRLAQCVLRTPAALALLGTSPVMDTLMRGDCADCACVVARVLLSGGPEDAQLTELLAPAYELLCAHRAVVCEEVELRLERAPHQIPVGELAERILALISLSGEEHWPALKDLISAWSRVPTDGLPDPRRAEFARRALAARGCTKSATV